MAAILLFPFYSLFILGMSGFLRAPVLISDSLSITDTSKDSTFTCHHPAAGSIGFKAVYQNGTAVDKDANNDIIFNTCHDENNILVYTMTIVGHPVYYGAEVICFATFDDSQGSRPMLTLTTTSGGTKSVSVGEMATFESASCSRIDWIVNGTHLNNLPVRDGDINVTSHRAPDDITRISILSIKARLPYNGTSITSHADGASGPLPIVYVHVFVGVCQESVALNFHLMVSRRKKVVTSVIIHLNQSSSNPMSDIIAIELSSLDGLDPTPTQLQVVPSFHDQKLSFTFTVPRRRIWNATLVHCKILRLELSTHDLQNISVSSPCSGQVRVTGDFIQGSTTTGILVILYREGDSRIIYDLISRSGNKIVTDITGVDRGNHEVFVFDVERNGTYSSATVKPVMVNVASLDSDETQPSPKIEYEIQSLSSGFRITCTFLDPWRISECVIVVHQKFPVHHDHFNVTLYHFRLGSVGNVVSGYIYVANPDDFQVAVIRGARKTKRTTSSTSRWASAVSCCLLAGLVIAAAGLIIYVLKKKMKHHEAPECDTGSQQLSQSNGTDLANVELENQIARESSHTDLSIQSPQGQTSPEVAEESVEEEKQRKYGPPPKTSTRRDDLGGVDADESSKMTLREIPYYKPHHKEVEPDMNSVNSQSLSLQNQHHQEDGDRVDTPLVNRVGITGSVVDLHDDGDELDDDTRGEVDFPVGVTEQSCESKLYMNTTLSTGQCHLCNHAHFKSFHTPHHPTIPNSLPDHA